MIMDKFNQYKLQCISADKTKLPIDLDHVRHHIRAGFMESESVIKDVIIKACEQVELATYKSILHRTWELTHCRSDIILKMPPIRQIISVFYKGTKKWAKIDLNEVQETFINDGERRIVVPQYKENQVIKVIYTTGSDMYQESGIIDGRFMIPYSIHQLLLKACAISYEKMKTKNIDDNVHLMSLCNNYCNGWSDPVF